MPVKLIVMHVVALPARLFTRMQCMPGAMALPPVLGSYIENKSLNVLNMLKQVSGDFITWDSPVKKS